MTDVIKKRILVVEDSEISQQLMCTGLKSLGFKEVSVVQDGVAALEMLKKGLEESKRYDLVIADVHMPRLNGLDLLKNMKKYGLLNYLDFVATSMDTDVRLIDELFESGAKAFMQKPYTITKLKEKLEDLYGKFLD